MEAEGTTRTVGIPNPEPTKKRQSPLRWRRGRRWAKRAKPREPSPTGSQNGTSVLVLFCQMKNGVFQKHKTPKCTNQTTPVEKAGNQSWNKSSGTSVVQPFSTFTSTSSPISWTITEKTNAVKKQIYEQDKIKLQAKRGARKSHPKFH